MSCWKPAGRCSTSGTVTLLDSLPDQGIMRFELEEIYDAH